MITVTAKMLREQREYRLYPVCGCTCILRQSDPAVVFLLDQDQIASNSISHFAMIGSIAVTVGIAFCKGNTTRDLVDRCENIEIDFTRTKKFLFKSETVDSLYIIPNSQNLQSQI